MEKCTIAVIVGSLRKDSLNRKLAEALVKMAPAGCTFRISEIGDLPLYNQDDDGNQAASVKRLKQDIESAQGVVFITPEYNRSISGVLKNAIDHASRPYGKSSWSGKPAAILGVSVGAMGTAMAQQHLHNITSHLNMPTLGQPEMFLHAKEGFFNADGSIGAGSRDFVQGWISTYLAWVKKHQ
ncbi:MAG: NAD(P)H-dependent oxidoreductase [Pseudomonadota bacterium]